MLFSFLLNKEVRMKRNLWGKFNEEQDAESREKQIEIDKEIMTEKRGKVQVV